MRSETGSDGWPFRLYALHLWTVFGIALSNGFLFFAGLAALKSWRPFPEAWRRAPHLRIPFLLYSLLLVVSILLSVDIRKSTGELQQLLSLITLPLAFFLVRGRRQVRTTINGLGLIVGVCALYGIAQLFFGYGGLSHRIPGPFSHYMTFAGVLLVGDFLLLAQVTLRRLGWKDWRWLALLFVNLALVGTLTRGAWVAFGLALIVLALVRAPRSLLLIVPTAIFLVALAPATVRQRIVSIWDLSHPTNYDRVCMVEAGFHMIAERPFFGIGPGIVKWRYPIYRQPTATSYTLDHLHNSFLQIGAEMGLPALVAYLWMMSAALLAAWRGYRKERTIAESQADLYLGVFLALLAFNLAGLFEANWLDTEIQRLVLFLVPAPFLLASPVDGVEPSPA